MPTKTTYEWCWEEVDPEDEYEDIIDVDFWDTLKGQPYKLDHLKRNNLALVKSVHDTIDGNMEHRAYAYVDKETLKLDETFFEDGMDTPKRFHQELAKWVSEQEAQ